MQWSSNLQPRSYVVCGAFTALGAEARADFESISVDMAFSRGGVLFHENTASLEVFLLHSGRVKLSSTSRDDRTLLLKIAVPEDFLGLSAVLSGLPYEVTASAICPTIVKCVPADLFR
jgi:CRP/FNR family cyclic AMP-dependent transcriptional regulator